MTCQDWRDAAADEVAALFDAERRRWIDTLRWDTTPSIAIVEQGRTSGVVPGWIARDSSGAIEGWTYYLLFDGALQIGGLTAARPAVARRLIDAVMQSAEANLARRLSCFVYPDSPSIASAFERQRFVTSETCYLLKPIEPAAPDRPAPETPPDAGDGASTLA